MGRSAERRLIARWRPTLRSNLIGEYDTAALEDSVATLHNLRCATSEAPPENEFQDGSLSLKSATSGDMASVGGVKEKEADATETKACEAPEVVDDPRATQIGKVLPRHVSSATSKTVWRPSLRT